MDYDPSKDEPYLPIGNMFQRYSPQAMQAIEGPYRGGWDPMRNDPVSLLAMSVAAPAIGRLVNSNPEETIPEALPELPYDIMGLFSRAAQLASPITRNVAPRVWSGIQQAGRNWWDAGSVER